MTIFHLFLFISNWFLLKFYNTIKKLFCCKLIKNLVKKDSMTWNSRCVSVDTILSAPEGRSAKKVFTSYKQSVFKEMDLEVGFFKTFFYWFDFERWESTGLKMNQIRPSGCGSFHDANERKNNFQEVGKNLKFYTNLCFLVKFAANIPWFYWATESFAANFTKK